MNLRRQPSPIPGRIARLTMSAALMASAVLANAAVRIGETTSDAVAAGTTPELVLFVWDPVKEVSYAKDLGLNVYKEFYAAGNTSTNLFVYGQQDSGYQKLFDPLNTDVNFQNFLTKSTNAANQIWAIVAVSVNSDLILQESGGSLYTTLNANTPTGTVNPEYTGLLAMQNTALADAAGNFGVSWGRLSSQAGSCSNTCFTDYDTNSSYVNVKGQAAYAGNIFNAGGRLQTGTGSSPNVFNAVGKSSWFYAATVTSDVSDDKIALDEFDNLGHDAYWGLGIDSNGNYVLSYTMEASLTQAQTAAGSLLRLRTDFAASYGRTRLIDVPVGDTLDLGNAVTAVPEPSTWGLMGLGLAVLAGRARRRQAA